MLRFAGDDDQVDDVKENVFVRPCRAREFVKVEFIIIGTVCACYQNI